MTFFKHIVLTLFLSIPLSGCAAGLGLMAVSATDNPHGRAIWTPRTLVEICQDKAGLPRKDATYSYPDGKIHVTVVEENEAFIACMTQPGNYQTPRIAERTYAWGR